MAFRVCFCSLVILLVSFLRFATFASSTTFSVDATAEVGTSFYKEAEALLNWKASLDNQNKSLLSSWVGDHLCNNWVGITCDDLKLGVTCLNLSSFGLKGTLYKLNFSSFPNLLTIDLSKNLFYGPFLTVLATFPIWPVLTWLTIIFLAPLLPALLTSPNSWFFISLAIISREEFHSRYSK